MELFFVLGFFFFGFVTVVLNGIKYEHLCLLVNYLYTGKTQIKANQLDEFFSSIKQFKILGINDFASNEVPNANNKPTTASASDFRCSLSFELSDTVGDDDDQEVAANNRTGQSGANRLKRTIDENQNGSGSQWGKTFAKRSCLQPAPVAQSTPLIQQQQPQEQLQQQLLEVEQSAIGPPSAEKTPTATATGEGTQLTGLNATENDAENANESEINGKKHHEFILIVFD